MSGMRDRKLSKLLLGQKVEEMRRGIQGRKGLLLGFHQETLGRIEGPEVVRVGRGRVPLHASNICVHCAFFTSGLAMSFKWTVKLWVGICACVCTDRQIYLGRRKIQSSHQISKGALDPKNVQNSRAYSFSLNKHCWLLYAGAVLC